MEDYFTPAFDIFEEEICKSIRKLEKQLLYLTAQKECCSKINVETLLEKLNAIEQRMIGIVPSPSSLEGLLVNPVSPNQSLVSNSVIIPNNTKMNIQHTFILKEEEAEEEEEEVVEEEEEEEEVVEEEEEVVEEEEEVVEEEEEVVEEEVEEEEEAEEEEEEEVELEEFQWKGKTYYKDTNEKVYRSDSDGNVEDEPFALYDPATKKLARIS